MITYLLVASCFIVGIVLQRRSRLKGTLTALLNNFAIYVALPAIIIAKVPQLEFSREALFTMCSAWLAMGISLSILVPIGRKLGWSREVITVTVVLAGLGNTAFLGMAMTKILFDDIVLGYAIFYDQLGSFLILSFTLPIVHTMKNGADGAGERLSFISITKSILMFPPFISLIAALTLPISGLADLLQTPLYWLGLSLLPLSMLIVGLQFQLRIEPKHRLPIALSLSTKMLLVPLIVLAAGLSLEIPLQIFQATVAQSAMPPMVTPAVFLISLNLAPRLTASILGLGTLISFVTIPTIAFVLN